MSANDEFTRAVLDDTVGDIRDAGCNYEDKPGVLVFRTCLEQIGGREVFTVAQEIRSVVRSTQEGNCCNEGM